MTAKPTAKAYDIVQVPDPVLKETAQPVNKITPDLKTQIERMFVTMYDGGIGLAANQVGLLNRIFVMDVDPNCWAYGEEKKGVLPIVSSHRENELEPHPVAMINPEILWKSEQYSTYNEGCLSLPGQFAEVERPAEVKVKYLDIDGNEQEMHAQGLVSHCIQHELDHLNGVLFVDYLSSLKRNMILRRLKKSQKSSGLL